VTLRFVPGLLLLLVAMSARAGAQVISVTASSVDLPSPDTLAYDAGVTPARAFAVMVTTCAGVLGCLVWIENPNLASPVTIALEWRLVTVSQVGEGALGCVATGALHLWMPLPASPVSIMETGAVTDPGTACAAGVEVRAAGISYAQHQYTSPSAAYWREVLFRAVEK
jgi:hypothetical protein